MNNVKPLQRFLVPLCLLLTSELSHARHAAIVVDANTGGVLQQVDANQAWYPASLTKVMTLYMAFDALKNGRLHLDDMMTISSHAAHQKPSKLGLKAWDRISVEDAILAVITRSANDAAVVLAEEIGGSEDLFATKMTRQAHELNMSNSNFMNATGLPHDRQVTTAHDMAVLAWRVQRDFPEYYRLFSTHSFYYNGKEYRSTNKFVASYPGAEGMKTGYTCGSGHNLIATAQQNGNRLIGVVLGGMTSGERYDLMYDLMDTGFSQASGYGRSYGGQTHINTMPTGSAGAPPYQLDCGNKPASTYVYKSAPTKEWIAKADVFDNPKIVRKSHVLTTSVSRNPQEWSVDLGAFHSQIAAESTNRKASLQLAQTLSPARPVVIKRQMFGNESRWHALWTGFDSIYAAGDACKALWQKNVQCTVSRPESLGTPRTASR
jgi:D-alanyl-D-alanine carboxypeptidase